MIEILKGYSLVARDYVAPSEAVFLTCILKSTFTSRPLLAFICNHHFGNYIDARP